MSLATQLERELEPLGTPARANGSKAYLKSQLAFFGVTVPDLRRTVRAAERAAPLASRAALFATVDALWNRGVFELKLAAVELLARRDDLVTAASLSRLRGLIASSHTWALVDPLSTGVVAGVYEREPAIARTLDAWARHDDFWIRRAALLAHLPQLRRGAGDFARFARFADAMLDEREFFIRKAIGWVLRETSKRRPVLVADWLAPRIARVSGVTLREAVKYLPAARKKLLLTARASPRSASAR